LRYLLIVGALALAGCSTVPAKSTSPAIPKVERFLVPVPCVTSETPEPGQYADDHVADMTDPVTRMTARAAANQQRKARLALLEPVIKACR
jgi:hypothetical protein